MNKVELYALSTCPWCKKTKDFLNDNNVPFDFTDYDLADDDRKKEIMNEMEASGHSIAFPYLKINGDVVVGWNPVRFKELLGIDETGREKKSA